jgi:hypothetical protein
LFQTSPGRNLIKDVLSVPPRSWPAHVMAFRVVGIEQILEHLVQYTGSGLVEFSAAKLPPNDILNVHGTTSPSRMAASKLSSC